MYAGNTEDNNTSKDKYPVTVNVDPETNAVIILSSNANIVVKQEGASFKISKTIDSNNKSSDIATTIIYLKYTFWI